MIEKAKAFATKKHLGQTRKGDGSPYVNHLEGTYKIAQKVTADEDILCACWLHDTLEDTKTTFKELSDNFGIEIANIVKSCTKNCQILDWSERNKDYLESVFKNPQAIIVAWADKCYNSLDFKNAKEGCFNVSMDKKVQFYTDFANRIKNKDMREDLLEILSTV
jgi:(p)ppGpp synthase/HD superfamily hydrolase